MIASPDILDLSEVQTQACDETCKDKEEGTVVSKCCVSRDGGMHDPLPTDHVDLLTAAMHQIHTQPAKSNKQTYIRTCLRVMLKEGIPYLG